MSNTAQTLMFLIEDHRVFTRLYSKEQQEKYRLEGATVTAMIKRYADQLIQRGARS